MSLLACSALGAAGGQVREPFWAFELCELQQVLHAAHMSLDCDLKCIAQYMRWGCNALQHHSAHHQLWQAGCRHLIEESRWKSVDGAANSLQLMAQAAEPLQRARHLCIREGLHLPDPYLGCWLGPEHL